MPIDTYPDASSTTSNALLGYAQVTSSQGTFTTEVDLTGLSVTVNVAAGRTIRVTGYIQPFTTVADDTCLGRIYQDGVQVQQGLVGMHITATGYSLMMTVTLSPTAGAHTYKLTGMRNNGSGNLTNFAAANTPSYIMVEDVSGGTGGQGPIQLGYAEITSTVTLGNILGETDVAGLSTTVTVPAGRRIRVRALVHLRSATAADILYSRLRVDSGNLGFAYLNENATLPTTGMIEAVHTPTAGTHTYKVAVNRSTGTGSVSIYAAANSDSDKEVSFIVVEDITGTPAPGGLLPSSQTLGYAEITANSATFTTSATDVTGLTTTVTVPAGRRIRISSMLHFATSSGTPNYGTAYIYEGATEVAKWTLDTPLAQAEGAFPSVILSPSAGVHTYNVKTSVDTGVGILGANANEKCYILVEDITGGAAPLPAISVPVGLLAQATNSADQALTTIVDLTNLTVNVTVTAGRSIRISGEVSFASSATGDLVDFYIYQDGVALKHREWRGNTANVAETAHIEFVASPSAGAHIYKLVMARGFGATGTITVTGTGDRPGTIYVEDITPTPASAVTAPSSTLDYKESQADSGTITTNADITGLTSTITVSAGRRIRVSFKGEVRGTTGDVWVFSIKEGATVLQRETGKLVGTASETANVSVVLSPSAGSHTYLVNLSLASGTGVIYGASSTYPGYLLVEDISSVATSDLAVPGALVVTSATRPGSPLAGTTIFETDTGNLVLWNGSVWQNAAVTGAWTAYTPTLSNITLGNGTRGGRWMRIGRTIFCAGFFAMGSTSSVSGRPSIGLPVAATSSIGFFGSGRVLDSGNVEYAAVCRLSDTGLSEVMFMISGVSAANGVFSGTTPPFTMGTGDSVEFSMTYEAAS